MTQPTLHLFCGKMAAGKSTLAASIAAEEGAILLNEDNWNNLLWPGEIRTIEDYADRAGRLRKVLFPMLVEMLRSGMSVVLDFPGNTRRQRAGLISLSQAAGVGHVLHLIETSDEECKRRLKIRNASGEHPFAPTEAEFELFSSYFELPSSDEGLMIIKH